MILVAANTQVWLAAGVTDMRKGLAALGLLADNAGISHTGLPTHGIEQTR